MKIPTTVATTFTLILLTACATVPMASDLEDAEAKRFQPPTGQANLYVVKGGGIGTDLSFQTSVDGRIIGSIARNTYQLTQILPGQHILKLSPDVRGVPIANSPEISFVAEAGMNYFFFIAVIPNPFGSPRGALAMINEVEGRQRVLDYKLAQSNSVFN